MISLKQQGYALLAVVIVLLGIGSSWFTAMPPHSIAARGISLPVRQQALLDARQTLLSYSAMYPYLYGPTGAGPGHLPCPDTDTDTESIRLDGPNPPCADQQQSVGRLPRHTVLPGHRYLFHAQAWQRFHYTVSGSVVNNPLNRSVNLTDLNQEQVPWAAAVSALSADESSVVARVAITRRAIAAGVLPVLSMWLMDRVNRQPAATCAELSVQQSANTPECILRVIDSERVCPSNTLLAYLLDRPVVGDRFCLSESLDVNTIEGVPARRHWFVRNNWMSSVAIGQHPSCQSGTVVNRVCQLVSSPANSNEDVTDTYVRLSWIAS